MIEITEYNTYMKLALLEAEKSLKNNEIPIGAIIVCKNKIIARAYNQTEMLNDVTAHAEIIAITSAANFLNSKYLNECSLFVTLEPCVMCAGAIAWAQINNLIFGTFDTKKGYSIYNKNIIPPKINVTSQILEKECSDIITNFFLEKRKKNKKK